LKRRIYNIVLLIILSGIPIFAFGIVNTLVSLKYETDLPTDCISVITGRNLCAAINLFRGLILFCIILVVLLLVFKKRLLGKTDPIQSKQRFE